MIVSSIRDLVTRTDLLDAETIIVPEGQRPRPMTCLHIAAKCGYNGMQKQQDHVLFCAVTLASSRIDDFSDMVTFFVKSCSMPVDLPNDKGDTPTLWAANDNQPHTVKLLISLGANVNARNDKKSSALHWACRNGHLDVVKVSICTNLR